jgi:hypothetical protein
MCFRRQSRKGKTMTIELANEHKSLEGVMDLQLDGFSGQNVVGGLILRYATDRGRSGYYPMPEDPRDIEIELIPCYGLDGFIRAKKVALSFSPGRPDKTNELAPEARRR